MFFNLQGDDSKARAEGMNFDGTPLLNISINNGQQQMSSEEVVSMTVPAFSALWAVSPFTKHSAGVHWEEQTNPCQHS